MQTNVQKISVSGYCPYLQKQIEITASCIQYSVLGSNGQKFAEPIDCQYYMKCGYTECPVANSVAK